MSCRPHQPARVSRTRVTSVSGVTRSAAGGSSQSSRHTPSGSGRAVISPPTAVVRHGGMRCSNASPGQGSSVRRAATACRSTAVRPGKRMPRSLRTVERGAVAADQVTAAPPGALGAAGVGGDAVVVLLQRVEPALHGDLDQRVRRRRRRAGRAVSDVLRRCAAGRGRRRPRRRSRPRASTLAHHLLAPHGAPAGPVDALVAQSGAAAAAPPGGRVGVQHDRAGEAGLVLARALVEDDGRHVLARPGPGRATARRAPRRR